MLCISAFCLFWWCLKFIQTLKAFFLLTIDILCFRGFISFIFLCASIYLGLVILSWGDLLFSVSIFYVMLITWIVAWHTWLQGTFAVLLEKQNINVAVHNLRRRVVYCVNYGISITKSFLDWELDADIGKEKMELNLTAIYVPHVVLHFNVAISLPISYWESTYIVQSFLSIFGLQYEDW
jgi:hypothetical protein